MKNSVWLCAMLAGLPIARTAAAFADEATFVCTNPSSGATWNVRVDFARRMVDAFPAEITNRRITWHDTVRGGIYELDRRSGALTVIFASSTGGYFLHDRCAAAP